MKRLREISKHVKAILAENKEARNNDGVLCLHVLRSYGDEKGIDIDNMTIPMYLLHGDELGLPSIKSIERAGRKTRELNPSLKADDEVQAIRELQEERYKNFAKEVHYV